MSGGEWRKPQWAEDWPAFREELPHVTDAERMLVDHLVRESPTRVLDLGCGDGRVIAVLRERWPKIEAIGLDFSPGLVEAAKQRFDSLETVRIEEHDLMQPVPGDLGEFDLVVSALAIHHLPDERKRALFTEVSELLQPGGLFYNLDVVAAPTPELHELSQSAFGFDVRQQDPSDQPARLENQLSWLHEAGFIDVDCFWKWLELSLVGGTKPR